MIQLQLQPDGNEHAIVQRADPHGPTTPLRISPAHFQQYLQIGSLPISKRARWIFVPDLVSTESFTVAEFVRKCFRTISCPCSLA